MPKDSDIEMIEENASGSGMSSLKQQRSSIKKDISNIQKKIEKAGSKMDSTILECRMEILESYFKQLCQVQSQIEAINPNDNSRMELEEAFILAKAKIMKLLNKNRGSVSVDNSLMNASMACGSSSRLPSLKLPKFDGKYSEYKRFITAFNNMVHENPSINIIEKFNYLLNCLSGAALAVVEPYQICEENYEKALDRLQERYDNKVLIFLEHIESLFNVPKMQKSDSVSLRHLIDTVSAVRGSLLSLGTEADVMNAILVHMVLSKVDGDTKENYDEKQDFKSLPSWDLCYELLSRRCQFLESHRKRTEVSDRIVAQKPKPNPKFNRSAHTFVNSNSICSYCSSSEHNISNCSSFANIVVSERFNFVKRSGHCINCLRKGHIISKCPSKSRCRVCDSAHHTLLHIFSNPDQPSTSTSNINSSQISTSSNPVSLVARSFKRAIIPTAVILMKDNCGSFQTVRALLDSCSELNFISEETAKRLKLKFRPFSQEISGIGEVRTAIKFSVETTIKSRSSSFEWSSCFAVTKSISSRQPGELMNTSQWKIPQNIELADPLFYKPQRIDVLLSAEVFFDLLLDGRISLGNGLPCLTNTVFGWIVGGSSPSRPNSTSLTCNLTVSTHEENIDEILKRFWEVEEYSKSPNPYTEEEQACEDHFIENSGFDSEGRVQVRLPFKKSPNCLGNSLEMARRRFLSLERRLERDYTLKSMYEEFMEEYVSLGHMSPYTQSLNNSHYIIPHHCVLKPQSATTKIRVVFDASARSSSNHSLNDILMVGPTIQQDLITTLFSFRLHKYALTADISKMYRQFRIDERDRRYQLVLWRSNKNDELKVFKLNTVTYGLSAAPFLAIRSLFLIADKYKNSYPHGSEVLRQDLYVDDVLTGADSIETLALKRDELIQILKWHGIELAKWNSNHVSLTSNDVEEIIIKTSDNDITKTLGMSWKPQQDVFLYRFELPDVTNPTKRSILSIVSKIYDLLGILSPIVIRCKILLQELWVQNIGWDDPLNDHLKALWLQIKEDLSYIHQVEVPRYVLTLSNRHGEIHGFADASQRAYGCCIYYRVSENGMYKTTLLIAKSKVAPIKAQSLPRLELCAAVLLSKTWLKIKSKIENFVSSLYFWTDSKIVLQWLKMHSSTLNCFVANRVSELQEETRNIIWRHVPTKSNPADIVSRGCCAQELSNTIWFRGPSFLEEDVSNWPGTEDEMTIEVPERRKAAVFKNTACENNVINDILDKQSSYYKFIRIIAYVFRIFNRCPISRSLKVKDVVHIAPKELEDTFWKVISLVQRSCYSSDIQAIESGTVAHPSLQKLTPFLHKMKVGNEEINILRVGGRLTNAPIPYDARFPALLPKDHRFVKLFVEHLHRIHLHAGPKVLLGILRQKIWIINAREVVRKIVRNCVHCFHYKPKLLGQIMGNLPVDRLRAQRPFLVTGVDFCGPFMTSYRIRGKSPYKTYIAVFVCFSSKATHLELVSDLSANNFILCLKRFVGRRGIPQKLFCDNATNFVGACNKLKELKESFFNDEVAQKMKSICCQMGLEFNFIPPRAPHFGGLWEAAVKSTKTLLNKNITESYLTFEELQTLVVEIEAILNSRPIAPMSDDPNDGEALTPGHLLIGSSLVAIPEQHFDVTKPSLLNRWQRISYLKQQFWQMWSRDYLLSLQQRSKWFTDEKNINEGQLVIIHEDNTPPQQWLLARIIKTIPGRDGKVRVVELKTKNGTSCRPIHKIAPLPIPEDV
ncbi:uncharacterized protein LOC133322632 [Musca vetustissima]|uniref:uncharacterized protein LOC133322632 n=1 Tax=Musca vetustissima TaxID=27455 RepID=UPI002AB7A7FF|nr:uncharacterized protein LOC133322632 [Musca vetustissima]